MTAPGKAQQPRAEKRIYINLNEYQVLVNLLEDALLTKGELDSDGHDAAFSILTKIGYPTQYRDEISERLSHGKFRYQNARRCQTDSHTSASHQRIDALKELLHYIDSMYMYEDGTLIEKRPLREYVIALLQAGRT